MEIKILQLIKLIGEEAVIFETFLQLLNRQQEALVANNMDLLHEVTLEQEQLTVKTAALESRRTELVRALSQDLKRDHSEINLTELTKLVSEPESQEIRKLQTTLLDLHEQIVTIKSRNDFLIKKSMEYLTSTISYLTSTNDKPTTYNADMERPTIGKGNLLVDRRA